MFHLHCHPIVPVVVLTLAGCVHVHTDGPTPPEASSVPEIKRARETKDKLQREARELQKTGNELDAITARISEHRVLTSTGSVETLMKGLIETTASLRQSAKAILDKGPQYIEKIDSFANTLQTSPETFTKAAKLFRTFADLEAYADIADDHRQVATLFENLATRTEKWGGTLAKRYDRDQLLETLQYIRHQERFLDRMQAGLQAQDCSSAEMEALLRNIETYTKRFEQFRAQIRDINAAFRGIEAATATKAQEASTRRVFSDRPAPDPDPKKSPPESIALRPPPPVIKPEGAPEQPSSNAPVHSSSATPRAITPQNVVTTAEVPGNAQAPTQPQPTPASSLAAGTSAIATMQPAPQHNPSTAPWAHRPGNTATQHPSNTQSHNSTAQFASRQYSPQRVPVNSQSAATAYNPYRLAQEPKVLTDAVLDELGRQAHEGSQGVRSLPSRH